MSEQRCQHVGGFPPSQCWRRAKRVIEGRSYCGVHAWGISQRRVTQDRARIREEQDDEEWGQRLALQKWLAELTEGKLNFSGLSMRDLLAIRELVEVVRCTSS